MNEDDHVRGLGKVSANLQSLELVLRVFLCYANNEHFVVPNAETASIPENHLTNPTAKPPALLERLPAVQH
jgi:hypothetical protein